jgi:hypothetical protein
MRSTSATFFSSGDHGAQLASHRCLQGQQGEGGLFQTHRARRDLIMVGDDLFDPLLVGLQQRLRGASHRLSGQAAQVGATGGQRVQLLVIHRAHNRPP